MHQAWLAEICRPVRSLFTAIAIAASLAAGPALAADPIKIGHVAALSGGSAQSGEAITRGLTIAIDEINAKGGLLGGRKLELVQRDDESPRKGLTAARELDQAARSFSADRQPCRARDGALLNKE